MILLDYNEMLKFVKVQKTARKNLKIYTSMVFDMEISKKAVKNILRFFLFIDFEIY